MVNPLKQLTKLDMNDQFPFGKHKGRTVERILDEEPSYIVWWSENISSPAIRHSIVATAEIDAAEGGYYPNWDNGEFYK